MKNSSLVTTVERLEGRCRMKTRTMIGRFGKLGRHLIRGSSVYGSKKLAGSVIFASILTGVASYQYGQRVVLSSPPQDSFPLSSTTRLRDINSPQYCNREELENAVKELKEILGPDNVSNSQVDIDFHSKSDFTTHPPKDHERAKFVVYPASTDDVSKVMKVVNKYNVPVVPFGGGTSLEGHFFSTRPGIVVDTSRMNKIIAVHEDDLDAVVQAGVNWQDLNSHLEPSNLMFGPDCGPNGLISGMINTNASGVNASRYGAMVANIMSVTVVLADGTIVKTKQRPRKSSAGYNLTGLFVGSEGTLGIITEATVKLHVKSRFETVVVGQFATIRDATNTVASLFRAGIQPNAIELLDKDMMHCINYCGYFTREWLEVPTIFFKIGDINETVVREYTNELEKIAYQNNCQKLIRAKNKEEQEELFAARKNAFYAILEYGKNEISENVRLWVTDIAVPISRLPSVLDRVHEMIREANMQSIIIGHVGDGNFHADIYYEDDTKHECEAIVNKMIELGLENEGTCTGEHGVGNAKRAFLELELGPRAIDLMRKIKLAVDPKRLLNPDKVFKVDPADSDHY